MCLINRLYRSKTQIDHKKTASDPKNVAIPIKEAVINVDIHSVSNKSTQELHSMNKNIIRQSIQKGFTLVELLIVVIILAILAAIVVPQFSATTEDAKLAAVDSTLANMRSAIDLYFQQHGEYPGDLTAVPSAACTGTPGAGTGGAGAQGQAALLQQLSNFTDLQGGACSISDATNHKFGPYIKKPTMPADPFKEVATIEVVVAGDLNMTATAGDPGGWKYDTKTGKLIVNIAAHQAR